MTKLEQKFANILGKFVITTKKRDDMEIGCVGICVAIAPSMDNEIYNVIVKHIDFAESGYIREILHPVYIPGDTSKYTWASGEKKNEREPWFYVYNINDLALLTN